MQILIVHIHVKPDMLEAFKEVTSENARNSAKEPGVSRFDFIQQVDDPTKFLLIEVYRDAEAVAAHKETAHYLAWRDKAVDMMAQPRYGIKYQNIYPEDNGW
jgi:quinol monooxygenase YgiN